MPLATALLITAGIMVFDLAGSFIAHARYWGALTRKHKRELIRKDIESCLFAGVVGITAMRIVQHNAGAAIGCAIAVCVLSVVLNWQLARGVKKIVAANQSTPNKRLKP